MTIQFKQEFEDRLSAYGVKTRFVRNLVLSRKLAQKSIIPSVIEDAMNKLSWAEFIRQFDWNNTPEGYFFWELISTKASQYEVHQMKKRMAIGTSRVTVNEALFFDNNIVIRNYPPAKGGQPYIKKLLRRNLEDGKGFVVEYSQPIYFDQLTPEMQTLAVMMAMAENQLINYLDKL